MSRPLIKYFSTDWWFELNETTHWFSAYLDWKNVSVWIKKDTVFRIAKKTDLAKILDEIQAWWWDNIAYRLKQRLAEEELKFMTEDWMEFLESFNEWIDLWESKWITIPNIWLWRDFLDFDSEQQILDRAFFQCYTNEDRVEELRNYLESVENWWWRSKRDAWKFERASYAYIAFLYYQSSEEWLFNYLYKHLVNKIDLDIWEEFNEDNVNKFLRTWWLIKEILWRFDKKVVEEFHYYNWINETIQTEIFKWWVNWENKWMSFSELDWFRRLWDRFRERLTKIYNLKFIDDIRVTITMIYDDISRYEEWLKAVITDSWRSSLESWTRSNFSRMWEMIRVLSQLIIKNYEYVLNLKEKYVIEWTSYKDNDESATRQALKSNKVWKQIIDFINLRSMKELKNLWVNEWWKKKSFLKSLFDIWNKETSLKDTELSVADNNIYLKWIEWKTFIEKFKNLHFMFQVWLFNRYVNLKEYDKKRHWFYHYVWNWDIELNEEFILTYNNDKSKRIVTFKLMIDKHEEIPSMRKTFWWKIDWKKAWEFFRYIQNNRMRILEDWEETLEFAKRDFNVTLRCHDHVKDKITYILLPMKQSDFFPYWMYDKETRDELEFWVYNVNYFKWNVLRAIELYIDSLFWKWMVKEIIDNTELFS